MPSGISRTPDSPPSGVEILAICTSGLIGSGGSAWLGTRATVAGKVPQPASSTATANAATHRKRDRTDDSKEMKMAMNNVWATLVVAASTAGLAPAARAALDVGEKAPDFTTQAALAGKVYQFSLRQSLAKGPVVLYFFPAAFSVGCSIEAHEFAEATPKFEALGASVVGVSTDDIETLGKFSVQACQNKFSVASDAGKSIVKSYDATMMMMPDYANRVSYVISPDGAIVYNYQSLNPSKHVEKTLAALRQWAGAKAAAK